MLGHSGAYCNAVAFKHMKLLEALLLALLPSMKVGEECAPTLRVTTQSVMHRGSSTSLSRKDMACLVVLLCVAE